MNEKQEPDAQPISRRSLIAGAVGAGVFLAAGGSIKVVAGPVTPVRPPGSQSEEHFIGACIRCNRCRGSCPRDAITACDFEDGIINVRTPRLYFHVKSRDVYKRPEGTDEAAVRADPYPSLLAAEGLGFCDFCMRCIENCPTGALSAFDPTSQWIGEAVIDSRYCIAFEKLGGCRKCADYCPFGAISIDENRYPVVDSSACNGCGICENICPSSTYRSYKGTARRGVNIEAGDPRPSGSHVSESHVSELQTDRVRIGEPRGSELRIDGAGTSIGGESQ